MPSTLSRLARTGLLLTLVTGIFRALPAQALVDVLGHRVKPGTFRRIVSLAPSNTELLFAMGFGSRVVGVTDFCDYPPQARRLPHLGGPDSMAVEKVIALHPDLVLTVPSQSPAIAQLARTLGVPVVTLRSETMAAVADNADELGDLLGEGGHLFAAGLRRDLAAIQPAKLHPRVFYLVWDRPLMTAGPRTFLNDLIARAGGINVVQTPGYCGYSEEQLLIAPPEVVVYPANLEKGVQALRERLPKARFLSLDANIVSRPGPRVLPLLRDLARNLQQKPTGMAPR